MEALPSLDLQHLDASFADVVVDDVVDEAAEEHDEPPDVPPEMLYGCFPPEVAPATTSKAPVDKGVQRVIDNLADEFARTGKHTVYTELCKRTENAGYFKFKAEWAKQGVPTASVSALQRLRAAAAKSKRAGVVRREDHNDVCARRPECKMRTTHTQYLEAGQIPFKKDMSILILDETNLVCTRLFRSHHPPPQTRRALR